MNLGGPEILVIIVVAILLLGPDKLPSALRTFGRVMGEVKKYQNLAKDEIQKAMLPSDAKTPLEDMTEPKETPTLEPEKKSEPEDVPNQDGVVKPILDDDQ